MGAESRNPKLVNSAQARAQARAQALEGIRRRREAIESRPSAPTAPAESQVGPASMFPNEAPPGFEESAFRRAELSRARDVNGRREELYNQFREAEAQRGNTPSSSFAAPPRGGIAFGPGSASRMPSPGTPEYENYILSRRRGIPSGMGRGI